MSTTNTSRTLPDTEPRVATGKLLWHFTMSLDGFVAGPNHSMHYGLGKRLHTTSGRSQPC